MATDMNPKDFIQLQFSYRRTPLNSIITLWYRTVRETCDESCGKPHFAAVFFEPTQLWLFCVPPIWHFCATSKALLCAFYTALLRHQQGIFTPCTWRKFYNYRRNSRSLKALRIRHLSFPEPNRQGQPRRFGHLSFELRASSFTCLGIKTLQFKMVVS